MSTEDKFWDLYNSKASIGEELDDITYELGFEFQEAEDGSEYLTEEEYEEVLEVYQQRNGAVLDIKEVENFLYTAFDSSGAFKKVDYLHSIGNTEPGIRIKSGNKIFNIIIKEV